MFVRSATYSWSVIRRSSGSLPGTSASSRSSGTRPTWATQTASRMERPSSSTLTSSGSPDRRPLDEPECRPGRRRARGVPGDLRRRSAGGNSRGGSTAPPRPSAGERRTPSCTGRPRGRPGRRSTRATTPGARIRRTGTPPVRRDRPQARLRVVQVGMQVAASERVSATNRRSTARTSHRLGIGLAQQRGWGCWSGPRSVDRSARTGDEPPDASSTTGSRPAPEGPRGPGGLARSARSRVGTRTEAAMARDDIGQRATATGPDAVRYESP